MWGEPPLSKADPDSFRTYFEPLLAKLEAKGMVLAGFELGNEINWAGFNADFPLPGQGRVFDKNDLVHDPEGRQIAQGLLQYVKTLTVLKEIRDHSKLNQRTPIISAGLADLDGSDWPHQRKADAVSVFATLDFLRTNGLDKLVDGTVFIAILPPANPELAQVWLNDVHTSKRTAYRSASRREVQAENHAGLRSGESAAQVVVALSMTRPGSSWFVK